MWQHSQIYLVQVRATKCDLHNAYCNRAAMLLSGYNR